MLQRGMPSMTSRVSRLAASKKSSWINILSSEHSPTSSSRAHLRVLDSKILAIENFLDRGECSRLIEASEALGFEEAKIDTRSKREDAYSQSLPTSLIRKDIRNNFRLPFEDETFAASLYARFKLIKDAVEHVQANTPDLTLAGRFSPQMRFYRYHPGQMFKPHADGIILDSVSGTESRWTFLVQLNDSYSGGNTIFYPSNGKNVILEPKVGQAVVFYHRVRHEGSEVLSGTKYVLRADVMFHKTQK